ncbi:MAG: CDP-diacylglycerol--serine O-phosphatidyltransferase [Kurthia gibsonii]|uniref:CDP-diacylglycerol--serine O-phosphatidyltransferase n=1 Tax=Kurthia gibsonii TaxID=33946 RepID=UPI002D293ADA|nr:CDP-diacylglycerol--serine O-phosphatidyltransferase [Kurthia gibsonii]
MLRYALPNLCTLCNFTCGVLAIYNLFEQKYLPAIFLISLGLCFDVLDGWTARKLHVFSLFGKELDSLSDLVTFGLAPAFLAYQFGLWSYGLWGLGFVLIYTISAIIRLARFNAVQSDLSTFLGLPVPAAAILLMISILCLPLWLWIPIIIVLSYLMLSSIVVPHFKKTGDTTYEVR